MINKEWESRMGAPKFHSNYLYKPLMRVISCDGQFSCGVCRSAYPSYGKAQSCLTRCFHEWIDLSELRAIQTRKGAFYQCPLCTRTTDRLAVAVGCIDDCKKSHKKKFRLESALVEFSDPLPAPPKRSHMAHLNVLPETARALLMPKPQQTQTKLQSKDSATILGGESMGFDDVFAIDDSEEDL
jgi:hypothetical protein